MNFDTFVIQNTAHLELCNKVCHLLKCDFMWVMLLRNDLLSVLTTDKTAFEHYWNEKYYLDDFTYQFLIKKQISTLPWTLFLSTCNRFTKVGFSNNLHTLFNIKEFASIEKNLGKQYYCFRFFTQSDRLLFMDKLIKNMPIIKYFMNEMIESLKDDLNKQPGLNVSC